MSIEVNVKEIIENVAAAAEKSGRKGSDITILAASKMNDTQKVREAFDAGIRVFGENRVQELITKYNDGAYKGADLHFIGHLQKNKVKDILEKCSLIHSVDSVDLAEAISSKAIARNIVQDILIEVNIGGEISKSGVRPDGLCELIATAAAFPGIRIKGLMAIPPAGCSEIETRNYFDSMYKLFVDTAGKKYDNVNMSFLSMGMSHDYEQAILSGSNIVRIGAAIFGARNYSK